jgi:signal transduction histidine kinase
VPIVSHFNFIAFMNSLNTQSGTLLLLQATHALLRARDFESVMATLLPIGRKITGAQGITFIVQEHDLCFCADEDAIQPLWKGSRFQSDHCIEGLAILNKQPICIEDIYTDERIVSGMYQASFIKSATAIPVNNSNLTGAIGIYWADAHASSGEELAILQALAAIAGAALENIGITTQHEPLQAQLEKLKTEYESLNKEFESFSYSISHDLRAPLRAIVGFAKMLDEDYSEILDDEGIRILGVVQRNAGRLENLIDELLKLSRIGKKEYLKISIDTPRLVQSTISEINNSISHKSTIQIGSLPVSFADYALLSQVWMNLLLNAIKFSSKKEAPFIEVGSYTTQTHIVYFIKDNGAGFDMAYADKLFGVFQRLHKPSEFEGTGIGLALVQRIVSKHGGTVWAEAVVNEGATFYFSLPAQN